MGGLKVVIDEDSPRSTKPFLRLASFTALLTTFRSLLSTHRSTSLFFWNHFVSLVKRGKIDYRNGSNKDKITLLHRMNTLARFDPYIELNPKLPQQRMSQLPEEDAVYCRQVAEER